MGISIPEFCILEYKISTFAPCATTLLGEFVWFIFAIVLFYRRLTKCVGLLKLTEIGEHEFDGPSVQP